MKRRGLRRGAIVCAIAVVTVFPLAVPAANAAVHVRQSLRATGVEPNAAGMALLKIRGRGSSRSGALRVVGRRLKPNAKFGIKVGGVQIGTLTTNGAGSGTARFSSQPTGTTQFLGVDPSGDLIEVSDDQGEDVMETDMPDDTQAGDVQCCVPDDDGSECEETSPADCTASGGTNMGTGSCFPNPCPTTPPTPDIQCCVPDDDNGPECEETSAADCADSGGVNMGSGSCNPNPCAPTPPPGIVTCCISQGDQGEQQGQPTTEPPECEQLTATDCTDEGGTASSAVSCAPNPCVASPCGAFLD